MTAIDAFKAMHTKRMTIAIIAVVVVSLLITTRIIIPAFQTVKKAISLEDHISSYTEAGALTGKSTRPNYDICFDGTADEFQLYVFQRTSQYSDSAGVHLKEFTMLSERTIEKFQVITSASEFTGDFKSLLSLIFTLEKKLDRIRIVNVTFVASQDRYSKKRVLTGRVIFQAIVKNKNEISEN